MCTHSKICMPEFVNRITRVLFFGTEGGKEEKESLWLPVGIIHNVIVSRNRKQQLRTCLHKAFAGFIF